MVNDIDRLALLRELSVIEAIAAEKGIALPSGAAAARTKMVGALRERYVDDPAGFCLQALGVQILTDDTKAMMESVRDNRITVAMSCNAAGKTFSAARIAAWFFTMWPDAKVYTTAAPPERNLKQLLWGEINAINASQPWLWSDCKKLSLQIERIATEAQPEASFITGVTIPQSGTAAQREAKFSGRHAPHLLFIVDEGDAVPDEIYKGIESCMSGSHDRLLVMFNPRAKMGAVYRMIRDGKANVVKISALDHVNVVTGRDVIPGAVSRETTVRRINEWSRPLADGEEPDANCFEVPEHLIGAIAKRSDGGNYVPLAAGWRVITQPELAYMVLARYPSQAEMQLIPQADVDAARARWDAYVAVHGEKPPEGTSPIIGLDIGEQGPDATVLCKRYGGWVARLVSWRGVDTGESALRATQIYKNVGARVAYVDAIGIGAGVAPAMRKEGARAQAVKVSEKPTKTPMEGEAKLKYRRMRDQLYFAVADWLRLDKGAMLPPDELLLEELVTPRYDNTSWGLEVTRKKVLKEKLKRSPDRLEALCMTFAPARTVKIGFY